MAAEILGNIEIDYNTELSLASAALEIAVETAQSALNQKQTPALNVPAESSCIPVAVRKLDSDLRGESAECTNGHLNTRETNKFENQFLKSDGCTTEKFILSTVLEHYKNTDISTYPVKPLQPYKPEKTWLISYGSHGVHIKNMNNLMMSAIMTQEFDVMIPYKPNSIDPKYIQAHKEIFSLPRGAGYWLWKPYLINKTLAMMPENDVLLYADSSTIFRDKIHETLKLIEKEDIVLFSPNHNNRPYMKKVVIDKIMEGDESIRDKSQLEAGFILLRNNNMVRNFVNQWLTYCEDPLLLTDIPSQNEYPDFKDHRHDQAVLTAVYYKNDCSLTELTFNKEPDKTKSQIISKLVGCQVKREAWW